MLLDVGDCFHCCIGGFRTTFACSQQLPEAYLCLCAKEQVSRISGIDQSTATAMHVDRGYKVAQRGKVQEQKQQLISLRPFLFCAALPNENELDQTELRFLEDFCNLLTTAHYRLLTEEEWQTATDEEFTVSGYTSTYSPM